MVCAWVTRDARPVIGFVQPPIEQPFLPFGQHAEAGRGGGHVLRQQDVQHGMQVLDLLGQPVSPTGLCQIGLKITAWRQQIKGVETVDRPRSQANHRTAQFFGEKLILQIGVDYEALQAALPVL